jgi:hypothetical protein
MSAAEAQFHAENSLLSPRESAVGVRFTTDIGLLSPLRSRESTMAKSQSASQIELMRHLADSRDANNFAKQLRPLLMAEFPRWFQILKVQKLVMRFRSVAHVRELREMLLTADVRAALLATDASEIEHHFEVCQFMQELFDQLDAETLALRCCDAHPDIVARCVARVIEIAHYGYQMNALADIKPPQRMSILQLSNMERQFRDVMDWGNIILNSPVAKNGPDRNYRITDAEIEQLLRLASLYEDLRQVSDLYAYQNGAISIKRRSLVLRTERTERDLAAAVGAERSADRDNIRLALFSGLGLAVSKECSALQVEPKDTFFDFLKKVGNSKANNAAHDFGHALEKDLEQEIAAFFDLGTEVTTKSGTFTVSELIRAWSFISTIGMLGQKWNQRLADVISDGSSSVEKRDRGRRMIRDIPVPELTRGWFVRMLARETGLPHKQSWNLVEQFTSRLPVGRIDLFYKPLLLLSNDVLLLPTPYIVGSRFERNIFMLIATETELDQKKKGYLPVLALNTEFHNAGFRSVPNFRVQVNHRELTDIDIVAFKDGFLFLGQCKIVIEPDSAYDAWKAESKLDSAASQLDICMSHLDEVRTNLFERLGLKDTREQHVVPFILTNTRQFTEMRFKGHPVVDIPYLHFVLGGARGSIIGTGSGKIGTAPGPSHIKGDTPTGEELAALLTRTIHKVKEREMAYRYTIRKIGDRKVHFPLMGMTTAGQGGLFFTSDEIFDQGSLKPGLDIKKRR